MYSGRNNKNASYTLNGHVLGAAFIEKNLGCVDNKLYNSRQCQSGAAKYNTNIILAYCPFGKPYIN